MSPDDPAEPTGPLCRLSALPARGKPPHSASVLDRWVGQAQTLVGVEAARLSWLVASTVVVAALQRAVDEAGQTRFLLKGGTYLQHRLGWTGRPTKDVDGLIRGDLEEFLAVLDETLRLPWGPLALTRTAVEVIGIPGRRVKPRRFHVKVALKGEVWRSIKVEIAPDEGGAADQHDVLPAPALDHFGIPTPDQLFGIAVRYQVAQKLHACSDPHDPPDQRNDRARDIVDLLLLRDLLREDGGVSTADLRHACVALFAARAAEATAMGRSPPDGLCPDPAAGPAPAAGRRRRGCVLSCRDFLRET
ncbi:MAG: nucleotidyl transferase AbiEii/AbiGii toxin family protein [Actinomycetes bacterium]